jgi:hypothetical protein
MQHFAPMQDFLGSIKQAKRAIEHSLGFFDSLVRRGFWHSISPSLDTQSFMPPLALTAPCMNTLAPRIMRLLVPPSIPSHLSHHQAISADEPIGLIQHLRGNRESQGFGGLQVDDELDL